MRSTLWFLGLLMLFTSPGYGDQVLLRQEGRWTISTVDRPDCSVPLFPLKQTGPIDLLDRKNEAELDAALRRVAPAVLRLCPGKRSVMFENGKNYRTESFPESVMSPPSAPVTTETKVGARRVTVTQTSGPPIVRGLEERENDMSVGESVGTVRFLLTLNLQGRVAGARALEDPAGIAYAARTVTSQLQFGPAKEPREAEVAVTFHPRPTVDGGEVILSNDRVRITSSTTADNWCVHGTSFGYPVDEARVVAVFKTGRQTQLGDTPTYRNLMESEIWPAIAQKCSPLRTVFIDHYIEGVRLTPELTEIPQSDRTVQGLGQPISSAMFSPDSSGAFRYGSVISLAELENQRRQRERGLKADEEDREKYAKLFAEIQSKYVQTPFSLGGTEGEKLVSALYHGEPIQGLPEDQYPFRLLYTRYVVEMLNKCQDRLADPVRVTIYEPRFVDMVRTTYVGGVPINTPYSLPAGTQPSYTLTVPRKFDRIVLYVGPANSGGQSPSGLRLMDLFMPQASPYSESEIRSGMGELFARYDCGSREIEVVGENIHRHASPGRSSLQREALLGIPWRVMFGQAQLPAAIREEDIIDKYLASVSSAPPPTRDLVESPAGRPWTNAEIFAESPYGKGDRDQTGAFFFKDYRGQLFVAGFASGYQPQPARPPLQSEIVANPDRLVVLAVPPALVTRIQSVLAAGQDRGGVYLGQAGILIEEDFPAYRFVVQNYAWRLATFLNAAARAVTLPAKP